MRQDDLRARLSPPKQGDLEGLPYMNWHTASPDRYNLLKAFAKENSKYMTEAESALWKYLKGNGLGHKFLRQHIIGDYIQNALSKKTTQFVSNG